MIHIATTLLQSFRFYDLIDILILSAVIYWILILTKGTRALYMLITIGLSIVALFLASMMKIYTTSWLLTLFFTNLPLIVIVLFQNEIRRVLTQLGKQTFFSHGVSIQAWVVEELVRTCVSLANKKIGALILLEQESDISDFIEAGHGHNIEAKVSRELIISIFMPTSPIHDGAITIKNDRITRVGCFLPLTMNPKISKHLGTRHRAAIGITEHVDVLAIVVSEETGHISAVKGGKLMGNLDSLTLRRVLSELHDPKKIKERMKKEEIDSYL